LVRIVRVITSRRITGMGHVACMGEIGTEFLLENLNWRNRLKDIGINERIILKLILEKQGEKVWIGFNCLKMWFNGGGLMITVMKLWASWSHTFSLDSWLADGGKVLHYSGQILK
jgi:hypothetical protein